MGEGEFKANVMVSAVKGALAEQGEAARDEMGLTTPGGRYQVRWDDSGGATMLGQLPFFAEFLEVTGVFERWERKCPMAYTSPNAPETKDVLGTWLLSILDGQSRYAHITGLRGDGVAPKSATTRSSPVAPATSSIPTGSPTSAWFSMPKFTMARLMRPVTACPA